MKYTVIVVAFERPSIFVIHTEADNTHGLGSKICEKADAETGCGPYEMVGIFEGWLENKCAGNTFVWEID